MAKHPKYAELRTMIPRHKSLPPAYAKTAVTLIDELLKKLASEEE
jgi:hypothetical protein